MLHHSILHFGTNLQEYLFSSLTFEEHDTTFACEVLIVLYTEQQFRGTAKTDDSSSACAIVGAVPC